jgi:hypothetical protein
VWTRESGARRLLDVLAEKGAALGATSGSTRTISVSDDGLRMPALAWNGSDGAVYSLAVLAPACSDGVDDDSDGSVDMADPQCLTRAQRAERRACGLGFEIGFVIAPLAPLRARRRATRTRP